MKRLIFLYLATVTLAIYLTILAGCNTQVNESESKTSNHSAGIESTESIPDSVIQFLITSAAADFNEHHPPTAIDFRNVKAGYISSGNEKTYLICGEFLSEEKKDWESFTTIKTSGYEQYIGGSDFCQKATFLKTDSNRLSEEIKRRLTELKK